MVEWLCWRDGASGVLLFRSWPRDKLKITLFFLFWDYFCSLRAIVSRLLPTCCLVNIAF